MTNWSEPDIALVYISGLVISLISAIALLRYFRSDGASIRKIFDRPAAPWIRTFSITVIIAALLGAMSVSFRDCHGNYDTLLNSRKETIVKGLDQVSQSFRYLHWILLLWLILFVVMLLFLTRKEEPDSHDH